MGVRRGLRNNFGESAQLSSVPYLAPAACGEVTTLSWEGAALEIFLSKMGLPPVSFQRCELEWAPVPSESTLGERIRI